MAPTVISVEWFGVMNGTRLEGVMPTGPAAAQLARAIFNATELTGTDGPALHLVRVTGSLMVHGQGVVNDDVAVLA